MSWFLRPMLRVVLRNYSTTRRYTTATLPTSFAVDRDENPASIPVAHTHLRVLLASTESTPNNIWSAYQDALNTTEPVDLDLKTHQKVLRRCTFSVEHLRKNSRRRYLTLAKPILGHVHEVRFQNVIRNILSLGYNPSRKDYHFVLAQFAAVGHSVGSMEVYKEMKKTTGCQPDKETIALVLQSIAHRLVVPERKADRPGTVNHARRVLDEILDYMQKTQMPWTGTNMDLTMRIMKHTSDVENFDTLLRLGYGIDMRFPDRPPLESDPNSLLPFTLHTLNTLIEMYGIAGDVSKLVQAFEVLTVPLPHAQAQKHFDASFDDEDDFGVTSPGSSSFKFPSAEPNTTSFTFLLRHICRQDHLAHLARHYLLQAIELDFRTSHALRRKIVVAPDIAEVQAPRMAINRAMFIPVFGLSNRNKNVPLMRWLYDRLSPIIRRKKADHLHFSNFIKHLKRIEQWPQPNLSSPGHVSQPRKRSPTDPEYVDVDGVRWRLADIENVLAVDPTLHQQSSVLTSVPKPINIKLHLRILKTDIDELSQLRQYVKSVLARTIERTKEKLGRRVWKGKDIYVRSIAQSGNAKLLTRRLRTKMSKEEWRRNVNYKPRLKMDMARPPSHFYHKPIRQQYWDRVKKVREGKVEVGSALGTGASSVSAASSTDSSATSGTSAGTASS